MVRTQRGEDTDGWVRAGSCRACGGDFYVMRQGTRYAHQYTHKQTCPVGRQEEDDRRMGMAFAERSLQQAHGRRMMR